MGNVAATGKGVPYTPSEPKLSTRFSTIWDIYEGFATADPQQKVTIFRLEKKVLPNGALARPTDVALAQNCLKRLKTLRHPYILKLLEGAETEESITMVTEPAMPLAVWLDRQRRLIAQEEEEDQGAGASHRPAGQSSSSSSSSSFASLGHHGSFSSAAHRSSHSLTTGASSSGSSPATPPSSASTASANFSSSCIWGLYTLISALSFLSNDCGLMHGNLTVDSVYVTKGGDWKLAGLELSCETKDPDNFPDRSFAELEGIVCAEAYRSPERAGKDWGSVRLAPKTAMDAFSLGVLMLEVFAGPVRTSADVRRLSAGLTNTVVAVEDAAGIPALLKGALFRLLNSNLKMRPSHFADELLTGVSKGPSSSSASSLSGLGGAGAGAAGAAAAGSSAEYFRHPLVGTLVFLNSLALKEPSEKQRFFKSLPSVLPRVPDAIAKYRLLPDLMNALEYGAAGGGGTVVLAPILEIGSRLPEAEYQRDILPCVIRLFASNDRATRVQLLHHLPSYVDRLGDDIINGSVLQHIMTGFGDTNPILREATVKGSLYLAPRLTEANLSAVLLKALRKMLMDAEPSIRVNTTICLGRIAGCFKSPLDREEGLLPCFLRESKDPFPFARVSALKAMIHCIGLPGSSSSGSSSSGSASGTSSGAGATAGKAGSSSSPTSVPSTLAHEAHMDTTGFWSIDSLSKKVLPCAAAAMTDPFPDARAAAFLLLGEAATLVKAWGDRRTPEDNRKLEEAAATGVGPEAALAASSSAPAGAAPSSAAGAAAAAGAAGGAGQALAGALGWAVSTIASRVLPSGSIAEEPAAPAPASAAGIPVAVIHAGSSTAVGAGGSTSRLQQPTLASSAAAAAGGGAGSHSVHHTHSSFSLAGLHGSGSSGSASSGKTAGASSDTFGHTAGYASSAGHSHQAVAASSNASRAGGSAGGGGMKLGGTKQAAGLGDGWDDHAWGTLDESKPAPKQLNAVLDGATGGPADAAKLRQAGMLTSAVKGKPAAVAAGGSMLGSSSSHSLHGVAGQQGHSLHHASTFTVGQLSHATAGGHSSVGSGTRRLSAATAAAASSSSSSSKKPESKLSEDGGGWGDEAGWEAADDDLLGPGSVAPAISSRPATANIAQKPFTPVSAAAGSGSASGVGGKPSSAASSKSALEGEGWQWDDMMGAGSGSSTSSKAGSSGSSSSSASGAAAVKQTGITARPASAAAARPLAAAAPAPAPASGNATATGGLKLASKKANAGLSGDGWDEW